MLRSLLLAGVSLLPLYAPPGEGTPAPAADAGAEAGAGANEAGDGAGGEAGNGAPASDAGGEAGAGEAGAAAPAGEAALPPEDWRDKELRRKHARLQQSQKREKELETELEAARAMLERGAGTGASRPAEGAAGGDAAPARPAAAQLLSDDDVQRAAQRIVAEQNFNNAANDCDKNGSTNYKDWEKVTDTLKTLGGFDPETMQQVLSTDKPEQVLHRLGSKPEEYQRVMDLPPAKRFAELVKLGIPEAAPKRRPSDAPAPIDPVGSHNRADPTALSDELADDEWYKRRALQKKARFEAKQRGAGGA